jgi:hypothetical protein
MCTISCSKHSLGKGSKPRTLSWMRMKGWCRGESLSEINKPFAVLWSGHSINRSTWHSRSVDRQGPWQFVVEEARVVADIKQVKISQVLIFLKRANQGVPPTRPNRLAFARRGEFL